MVKQFAATCYQVRNEKTHDSGCFTVVPEIGLVQVSGDYGTFAHQYSTAGKDFKRFLLDTQSIRHKLGMNARTEGHKPFTVEANLTGLMTHLWPLFIEQLKAEMAEKTEVPA